MHIFFDKFAMFCIEKGNDVCYNFYNADNAYV